MTARPDVPDTPDRTDAVARVIQHAAYPDTPWDDEKPGVQRLWIKRAERLLTTDDPAAIAALAATLWERHPSAVLTAGVNAGVLSEERAPGIPVPDGRFLVREHLFVPGLRTGTRLATVWRGVTDD